MRYLDASVLAKAFVLEPGVEQVRRWLAGPDCATASLTLVEVASAIARSERERRITTGAAAGAVAELASIAPRIHLVELSARVIEQASALLFQSTLRAGLFRRTLRAGDAVQLASALVLRDCAPRGFTFACADGHLADAARAEGLVVEVP
ncbi:MAG: PIN domain-containing protein [Myxococcales bacterium]|nr:PIN domain-containing protein [Myxococcales bacterium]